MQSMMPGRAEGAVMTISAENEARGSHWIWASLIHNLPYVTIVALALVGISLSSLSSSPSVNYWVVVTPIIAAICILEGWRHVESGQRIAEACDPGPSVGDRPDRHVSPDDRRHAARAQRPSARPDDPHAARARGCSCPASTSRSWKLCLTGAFLIVSVPATAWLQNAALLPTPASGWR